jgi:hypothetical protein
MKLPVPYQITIEQFYKDFAHKVIRCKKFNRLSCWQQLDQWLWRNSLRMGWCVNPLIYVNIQSCIDKCLEEGWKEDVEYFQNYKEKGYTYLTIEGGNRHDESVRFHDDIEEKYWKTKFVNIAIVESIGREEMHQLYCAMAGGKPPNPQERRTGIYGIVSDLVRNSSNKISNLWEVISVDKDRMGDDELTAIMLSYCTHESFAGIKGKGKDKLIDSMYETNEYDSIKFNYLQKHLQKIGTSIQNYGTISKKLHKTSMYLLTHIVLDIKDRYKIDDYDKFVKYWHTLYLQKMNDDTTLLKIGTQKYAFSNLMRGWSSTKQVTKIGEIVGLDFVPFLEENKAISLTNTQNFSQQHKIDWINKNKFRKKDGLDYVKVRCNTDDFSFFGSEVPIFKEITIAEAINGNKYELDHIKPKVNGGPTTLENGELTTRDYNRKKSKKVLG